jgi:hypothetical protein
VSTTRLIRAAGLRWPVEEGFEFGKSCFGLDQSQVRLYHAIARHTVLVMAALAICAVTAALLRDRTDTQAPPPQRPDQPPPADPGMIPLTVPEITRLLAARPEPRPRRALDSLAAPPPSPRPLAPQTHPPRPRHRNCPGHLTNGDCRTRDRDTRRLPWFCGKPPRSPGGLSGSSYGREWASAEMPCPPGTALIV